MQQFMTGEQVARIVTMPGEAWVNYDADYIQGEFDFEVAAGSTEPMNETFRRQSALQLVDASMPFLEMGVANPQALYMHILQKGFGIKDVSASCSTGRRQQMARPQQGQLPPGDGRACRLRARCRPDDRRWRRGRRRCPPSGRCRGPPIEQMPMGGTRQIPPEMLMAQMLGGAPPVACTIDVVHT